jgi:hypothetical protein
MDGANTDAGHFGASGGIVGPRCGIIGVPECIQETMQNSPARATADFPCPASSHSPCRVSHFSHLSCCSLPRHSPCSFLVIDHHPGSFTSSSQPPSSAGGGHPFHGLDTVRILCMFAWRLGEAHNQAGTRSEITGGKTTRHSLATRLAVCAFEKEVPHAIIVAVTTSRWRGLFVFVVAHIAKEGPR